MKSMLTVLLAMSMAFAITGTSFADLTDGLVAYYPFNGNANDESGNGNDGVVAGAILTTDRCMDENSAFEFDGDDDDIMINDDPTLRFGPNDFAISAWIYPTGTGGNHGWNAIITKHNGTSDDGSWVFRVANDEDSGNVPKLSFSITNTSGPDDRLYANTELLLDNEWYHAAVVRENNELTFYLNSELDGSFSCDKDFLSESTMYISDQGNVDNERFTGKIDEMRIYNRSLSEEEIWLLWLEGRDADGDEYPDEVCGGDDCDDTDPDIHPDAPEIKNDGIDSNCSCGGEVGNLGDICDNCFIEVVF